MRFSFKWGQFQNQRKQSSGDGHTVYALVLGIGLSVVLVGAHNPSSDRVFSTPVTSDIGQTDPAEVREILDRYCIRCHNERRLTAGLALDVLDIEDLSVEEDKWENPSFGSGQKSSDQDEKSAIKAAFYDNENEEDFFKVY